MINELYDLSEALKNAQIQTQNWHREYIPIPTISAKAPCVRITVSDGKVVGISEVDAAHGQILRKYGSNQGSYPCMNLAPLYRITDEAVKKELADIKIHPERIDSACVGRMKTWCGVNNWGSNFQMQYKRCMKNKPEELASITVYEPLQTLINETNLFSRVSHLHAELERVAWEMIERRENTSLALTVLFFQGKNNKNTEAEYTLSVAFESAKLIDEGIPAVSEKFVVGLNQHLLDAESEQRSEEKADSVDAFGVPFRDFHEAMPKVKLAGGFNVIIRTMFKDQLCQTRYGKIEDASYPISPSMRKNVKAALEWVGSLERENITWINTDKNERLFAYPLFLPDTPISFTAFFKQSGSRDTEFSAQAKQFIQELQKTKEVGTDTHAKRIRLFILRKINRACYKIVYTKQTDPYELEKCSEEWTRGCGNLPTFPFGNPKAIYPLDAADVLNRFWKQNGEIAADKFAPFPKYHGIEILMDMDLSVLSDMHRLSESAMTIGAFFGNLCANEKMRDPAWGKVKDMLALLGLFLYRENIRKDDYMENLPYNYGQLLKAADELHALYCKVVRNGDVPPQLVGSSLFQNAAEAPVRTLNLLSQRIMPYYSWAKSYRLKGIMADGKESWRAGWLYRVCEETMGNLQSAWTTQTRFSDEEKAQLFIGYLAAFPKKEQNIEYFEEESTNE